MQIKQSKKKKCDENSKKIQSKQSFLKGLVYTAQSTAEMFSVETV